MADKRNASKPKKNQRDDDKRGGGETSSSSSKRGLQGGAAALEVHEYQCSGDFLEDYKQSVKTIGIPVEEAPKLVPKPNYSLWRSIELPAPPLPVSDEPRLSQSPPPDLSKFAKVPTSGGKTEPHAKASIMDPNPKGKIFDKDKGVLNDKKKKKTSKTTNGKTEQSSPKSVEQKMSPSNDNMPRGASALEANAPGKKLERLFTSKGRDKDFGKGKDNDITAVQDPSLPVVEGNEAKPLQVVYEPFTQNKVKEVAIRGWLVDRQVLEVLQKCFVVAEKLTTLILADCGLKGSDMILLSDLMPKIPNLEFLALDGNFISEQNHGLVLSKPSTLRSLTIRFANLDDKALQNLSSSWKSFSREWAPERPGLEYLDLSRNKITDGGLEYLAQVLRFNRSLTTLSLAGNRLSDKAIDMLSSCVFTRFLLNSEELLERRTRKAQYTPPIVNPAIYALKRKYQQAIDAEAKVESKSRSEKDDRKRDKDDKKGASGSRMSGARISAGNNTIKPSPPAGARGTGSAHPERNKPGTPQKQIGKSGSKNVPPSSNSSQPQVHIDDVESSSKSEQSKEVPSRLKAAHDTHGHHKEHTDEGESVASASHIDLTDPASVLNLEDSEDVMANGHAAHSVPSVSSQDGLYAAPTASLDSRLAALLNDLRKHNHAETALADYDIWLDRSKELWRTSSEDPQSGARSLHAEKQNHKGFSESTGGSPRDYQAVLLKYCQGIVNGTVSISALPDKIQRDLLKFAEDPYFMFANRKEDAAEAHNFPPPEVHQPDKDTASSQQKAEPINSPKFQLQIIAASVTNLEENETNAAAAIADGSSEANRKGESQLSNVASTTDIARSPEAAGKLPLGETAPAHGRLSTGISRNTPRVAASATPGHRKLSVKKVKGKKGEAESSPDVPVKECPYYTMITVEEKFDALVDGMILTDDNRVICDGNRTLKVLNLMSNRLTPRSVFTLMETVNKQREEQAAALMWESPLIPEVVLPRPPPAPAVSVADMLESESNVAKKEAKSDERSTAKKSAVPRPRPAATDIDSVTSSVNNEDGSGDECSPVVLQTRLVKNSEDPNRQNAGLLFVELEHNTGLKDEEEALELFDTFMHQQRESLGVTGKACTEELHDKRTSWRHSVKKESTEIDPLQLDLKELPLADPARYSLLKSQYLLEKKKEPSISSLIG